MLKKPSDVQVYLAKLPSEQRRTVTALRNAILKAKPSLALTLNPWGYLAFSTPTVKYAFVLVPHPKHINLQIYNGAKIARQLPELEGSGKGIRHIRFPYGMAVNTVLVIKAVRLSLAA
ncbi:MAG TPA: DUF1801 domain-containing protein [Anaerolineales bacterium]|nr:DUF1801 domain-containing protein [Anaerolineales bacterium]